MIHLILGIVQASVGILLIILGSFNLLVWFIK